MSSPSQNLAAAARRVIAPGRELIRAAQPLADPKRALGRFQYQWLDPGPNSRMVMANGSVALPDLTSGSVTVDIFSSPYTVPEGWRFVLTGIAIGAFASDWVPGSGQLTFTLVVQYSTGPRNVEWLQNMVFGLGTVFNGSVLTEKIDGRLEFEPLAVLQPQVTNSGIGTPNPNDYAFCVLRGFEYPNPESAP